jgi:hypothetical protein
MEEAVQTEDRLVPAFETSLGIGKPDAVMVPESQLKEVNKKVAPNVRYAMKSANIASLYAKRAVRPDEIAALRREMFEVVRRNLPEVEQVILGNKAWKSSQVRLYALLTERVIPKMQSVSIEDNTQKRVEDLSIEELEALALGKKREVQERLNTIEIEAKEIEASESRVETEETRREVVRELANIQALDDAEKKYITRLAMQKPDEAAKAEARRQEKAQPAHTPEQMEKIRQKNGRSLEQRWREAGYTDEEIKEKMAEVVAKRAATRKKTMELKDQDIGYGCGLKSAERAIIEDIKESRNKTFREFRVNPLKGRRSKSVVQREIEKKQKAEQRRYDKEVNPLVFTTGKGLGIEEDITGIHLQELKQRYPHLFEVSEEDREKIREIDRRDYERAKERRRLKAEADHTAGSGEIPAEDQESGA